MVKSFIAAVTCMALVAACAGAKRSASPVSETQTMAGATPSQEAMPSDPRAEIERLFGEIEKQRGELGMTEPVFTSGAAPATPMATVPKSTDLTCKPAKTDRCTQSCVFSDSICDNAGRICDIAKDLTADKWAADKCTSAKLTCETAHETCCDCRQ